MSKKNYFKTIMRVIICALKLARRKEFLRFRMSHNLASVIAQPVSQRVSINQRVFNQKIAFRNFTSHLADKCWSCNHVLPDSLNIFCPQCDILQKVASDVNHFEILGLTAEFPLDATDLTKRFRQLQSQLHPDKFGNKSPDEKSHSDDWSALVNRAYKTLLVPLTRAEYLLELNGVPIPEDNSVLDAEFLMEMMEKNEEIEEADTEDLLREQFGQLHGEIETLYPELEVSFASGYFEQVVRTIIRLRYLYSIENSIKTKLEKMISN